MAAEAGGGEPLVRFVKLSGRAAGRRSPPARSGHRCVADNTNLYVFGGYNPDYDESGGPENEDYPLFRELWRYHFATGTWHQMGTDGYMPRELASMSLVLHGYNLLVFGGTGIPFGESNGNDVHVCNVKYKRWEKLNCDGKKPNRIYGQAMAIINGFLYVFGGTTGYIYSTDLHRLDLSTREWVQLKPNNPPCDLPEERYRHEIAHDNRRIYVLGGGTSWTAYSLDKAGCMYIHGGVVNIQQNKRTGSLFKIWLVVPSLLELCWENLLKYFPHLAHLPTNQLLQFGLSQGLIERLK
ncbi:hypothetical protein GDO78_005642 [Eleutherodactylus coqui]|uniref:Kelch domain containing 10 n=1 Tax=Eleutherodactylus coqui TaxID=57060 RepID=A0A8J6KDD5_ELECQ|nr:hypothetical protein GDO78_005642 [Eleutherodactylus coqui]